MKGEQMRKLLDEDEIREKAIAAHARYCNRGGFRFDQPDKYLSELIDGQIVLRNVGGEIARFNVKGDGNLHRVKSK
jgi:tRNA 2-selenouridine synthase SelU